MFELLESKRVSNPGVAALTNVSGGYPSTKPYSAVLTGEHPGQTQLTSTTDIACFHTQPRCLPPVETWTITLRVVV